jgi:diaminohydroxyphosphoribosylaminopyrimidine deaminase/5-amino-6-(5-phosphoribosylamino)uracil reductase
MRQAIELAALARGRASPNPMVGAVLVKDDRVLGQGYHRGPGLPHAEIEAMKDAGGEARGATLYVNLEPCGHQGRTPPCTDAISKAGIVRVVAAMMDPHPLVSGNGLRRLRSAGVEVDCGVLEGEARRLNEAFVTYHLKKRPFTIAKWAMTLDGRTSTDTGDSRWISNDASREYVHELRSTVDAIAVGVGTVVYDNPRLNVRLKGFNRKQPARVILDGRLRIPLGARCLKTSGGENIILTTLHASEERIERLRAEGHTVLVVPGKRRIIAVDKALETLAQRGIQSVLVEGGREVHTSLLRAGLADKVVIFVAPVIVGGGRQTSPTFDLGVTRMKAAMNLKNVTIRTFGANACIEGYLNPPPAFPKSLSF